MESYAQTQDRLARKYKKVTKPQIDGLKEHITQEARLNQIAKDFISVVKTPAVVFGSDDAKEKRLQGIASDLSATFGEAAFSQDEPDQGVIHRMLAATPQGRAVLKEKGITPPKNVVTEIDVLRARGDVEPRQEVIDRMLAATPIGKEILRERKKQ